MARGTNKRKNTAARRRIGRHDRFFRDRVVVLRGAQARAFERYLRRNQLPDIDDLDRLWLYHRAGSDTVHVRDARGVHCYVVQPDGAPSARLGRALGAVYYGRIRFQLFEPARPFPGLNGRFRRAARTVAQAADVHHVYIPLRATTRVMDAEMRTLFGEALTATAYAARCGLDLRVGFNWCHLVAHGLGGRDDVANLVAATTHCNSEQLIIENTLYVYKNEPGISVRVTAGMLAANPVSDSRHLAETIQYEILVDGAVVFTHVMNALRPVAPSYGEETALHAATVAALNDALVARGPVPGPRQARALTEVRRFRDA